MSVAALVRFLLLALAAPGLALAQGTFASKPVKFIVPYSPGGGTDILTRTTAQKLGELWGQTVIVENRAGANGVIGTRAMIDSPPDGTTLAVVVATHVINAFTMKEMSFDPRRDVAPVTVIASSPFVLVIPASSQWKTVKDLVAEAKANPGKLSIAHAEGSTQLTGAMFAQAAGVELLPVAYKGGALIMTDLIGGHLAMGFTSVTTALSHVKSGKLRVIGVAQSKRVGAFPDAPTFTEGGVRGVESAAWYGVLAPPKTPPEVLKRLQTDIAKVLATPEMKERVAQVGAEPVGNTPEQFAKLMDAEYEKWARVAKAAGVKPE
jgi:tripartite-type tricarboxylate transporter receptor subunit TctC